MEKLYKNLPLAPGVYIMKSAKGEILYIGKTVNLRRRVSSYFLRSHEYRLEKLVSLIKKIDYKKTDSGLEALILESELIKKHQPPFNVLEKDDKSFLYVKITREKFPRVLLVRGKDLQNSPYTLDPKPHPLVFGPFTSASALREALKIIRRIFQYSTHDPKTLPVGDRTLNPKPCFDYQIGLCPGPCANAITPKEYAKNIRNIKLFFSGKKHQILRSLEKEMKQASKELKFEKAEKIRRQIFSLKHIEDTAFISESSALVASGYTLNPTYRIEGYDISNISGTSAVGSMVVFINGRPDRNEYRKFKIHPHTITKNKEIPRKRSSSFGVGVKTIPKQDDVGMIKQILSRRLDHADWSKPNLILIDGGVGQVNAVKSVLAERKLKIPTIGIAKGPERKRNDFIGILPKGVDKKTLIQIRDEAHRFALNYHRKLRSRNAL